jgi:hypothetical protein
MIAALAAAVILIGVFVVTRGEAGVTTTAARVPPPRPTPAATPPGLFHGRLLVYANDTLTDAQVRAVRAATRSDVAAVALREEDVASGKPAYPRIPVMVMVTDPTAYARAVGDRALAGALARGAVLAATEARLRHVAVGGTLRFVDGRRVRVSAIVDDHVLGGNEMSLPASAHRGRVSGADYLLVDGRGNPAATERAIRTALRSTKVRVVARGENGFMSAADRVLTQMQVKQRFGEFAISRTGATTFEQDPSWVNRYLVTTSIPQLGLVTCNRGVIPALRAAMVEVTRRGLGSTVHTADFQYEGGCWNPNVIPGVNGTISRHSWGLAVDINVDTNAFGYRPHQDGRLVSILARHGFTWGGRWLTPDGMHFEFAAAASR